MARILMISTSREVAPQPTVPIGAAWVAEALHLAGFQVKLLDLCFEKDPVRAVGNAIRSFAPDGIGISIRNLDNCDFLAPVSFLPEIKTITDFIKSVTDVPILVGGAGVSIMPAQVLDYLELDHAVVGEGERAAVEFFCGVGAGQASTVAGVGDVAAIAGVVTRKAAAAKPPCRLPAGFVTPRLHNWVDAGRYLAFEPVLPVQGKRGCANRCLYCTYNRIEGESWRLREPAAVVDEIAILMRATGAREFEFVDSIFNQPEGYLESLMEEILRRPFKARFRVSSLSPKGLTREQVGLMERAGVTSLVVTPESAADATLAALRKDFTEDDVLRAAELFAASKIRVLWCFLFGSPCEDARTLGKTIGFINTRIAKKDAAFITAGIRIYPGTALYETAVSEGVVHPAVNLLMPTFYFSPQVTPQQAKEQLHKEIDDLSRCIFVSDTRLGSLSTLRRIGTALRLPSPFWRYAGCMNMITAGKRAISRNWSSPPTSFK